MERNKKEASSNSKGKSVISLRQCTMSQGYENDDQIKRIELQIAFSATI